MTHKIFIGRGLSYADALAAYGKAQSWGFMFHEYSFRYCSFSGMAEAERMDLHWIDFVDFPDACPTDCTYLVVCKDVFGTGDSPSDFDCTCLLKQDCPLVIK